MMLLRLALAFGFALLAGLACADEAIFPPGSRIGLVPPPGMTAGKTFQGFEDRARGAVLMISEFTALSHRRLQEEFSDAQMRAGGMEPIARENIETASGPALLVAARQIENGVAMRKWALLALVPDDITAVVVAKFPEAAAGAYPDSALRAALMSLLIKTKLPTEELLAALPYRLRDLAGFRLLRASPDGTAVLTRGPKDISLPVEQPYFMVATRAVELPPASEQDSFARRTFMTFAGRPDLRIVSSTAIRIGGAPGHELIAQSKDEHTGEQLTSVQWLIFGGNGFAQLFGVARTDQWDSVVAQMRALRDGFEMK
jgi:hypothetical protein